MLVNKGYILGSKIISWISSPSGLSETDIPVKKTSPLFDTKLVLEEVQTIQEITLVCNANTKKKIEKKNNKHQ